MQLVHNARCTAARTEALRTYYRRHVLKDDAFICHHAQACRASCRSTFVEGQLNAPGACYDLTADGVPLRVVIVGQETGTLDAHVNMARRRERLHAAAHAQRFRADGEHRARTQHLKGVTSALRLLLDKGLGEAYEDEFIELADGTRPHLFDCFALVNFLLCSAVSTTRSKRGESTATMRRNCSEHFRATLDILEPTVLIAEGKSFWPNVRRAFDHVEELEKNLFRTGLGERTTLVASFTHPSAMHPHNWGSNAQMPYLLQTVVPTLSSLRRELFSTTKKTGASKTS